MLEDSFQPYQIDSPNLDIPHAEEYHSWSELKWYQLVDPGAWLIPKQKKQYSHSRYQKKWQVGSRDR